MAKKPTPKQANKAPKAKAEESESNPDDFPVYHISYCANVMGQLNFGDQLVNFMNFLNAATYATCKGMLASRLGVHPEALTIISFQEVDRAEDDESDGN